MDNPTESLILIQKLLQKNRGFEYHLNSPPISTDHTTVVWKKANCYPMFQQISTLASNRKLRTLDQPALQPSVASQEPETTDDRNFRLWPTWDIGRRKTTSDIWLMANLDEFRTSIYTYPMKMHGQWTPQSAPRIVPSFASCSVASGLSGQSCNNPLDSQGSEAWR